jgi:hypothetical protein
MTETPPCILLSRQYPENIINFIPELAEVIIGLPRTVPLALLLSRCPTP